MTLIAPIVSGRGSSINSTSCICAAGGEFKPGEGRKNPRMRGKETVAVTIDDP